MLNTVNEAALKMKSYFNGDLKKIQHTVRVYTLSKTIGELEKLPEETQEYLEIASLFHEIKNMDELSSILSELNIEDDCAERVLYIIQNKNDYDHITGLDHQILIEADFIVHIKDDDLPTEEIIKIGNKYFFTNYGRAFLKRAFNV